MTYSSCEMRCLCLTTLDFIPTFYTPYYRTSLLRENYNVRCKLLCRSRHRSVSIVRKVDSRLGRTYLLPPPQTQSPNTKTLPSPSVRDLTVRQKLKSVTLREVGSARRLKGPPAPRQMLTEPNNNFVGYLSTLYGS